jgi:hypothetical protein
VGKITHLYYVIKMITNKQKTKVMEQQRNEKCNCGSGFKYKKCCMKTDSIYSIPTNQTYNKPMKPIELFRTKLAGTPLRFVKYHNAPNVEVIPSSLGKPNKDGSYNWEDIQTEDVDALTIVGSFEIIIPQHLNNQKSVNEFTKMFQPMFLMLEDVKWFKSDRDSEFEKKGDNVLELYGYITTDSINKQIQMINQIK